MAETWQNSYEELKQFIAAHPDIKITPSVVAIMGDTRQEFYTIFDTIRAGFIKERFATELEKAYALSAAYNSISKAVKEEHQLEDIEINANLNWFLLDPTNGLMRVLFDPLFDLLKDKMDLPRFIQTADTAVKDSFATLFREGYERWGALALFKLLAPSTLWMGKTHDFYVDPSMEGDIIEGNRDDFVPDPVESRKLVFDNMNHASFLVPGALVYSTRLKSYVSLRPRWYPPRWKARQVSDRMEWVDLRKMYRENGTGNLWPDMMIHVTDERPEDLKLLSDYYRLARPDILVEFMEEDDWYDEKRVADIMRHNLVLNPRLGTYVVSRAEVPAEAFKPLEAVAMPVPPPPPVEAVLEAPAVTVTEAAVQPAVDVQPLSAASEMPAAAPVETVPPPPPMARPLSLAELPLDVHVLNVGYDINSLEPLVKAIGDASSAVKEARMKELAAGENPSV